MRGPARPPMTAPHLALALALQATLTPSPVPDELTHRRLVLANTYALELGVLYPAPSGAIACFLGSDLLPRRGRQGRLWRAALGYQLTLAAGHADLAFAESPRSRSLSGLLTHRHALALLGRGGARGRLFYSVAAALVFGGTAPIGADAEARLGRVVGGRPGRRARAVIGGELRLGARFGGVPLPQFGVFVGVLVF